MNILTAFTVPSPSLLVSKRRSNASRALFVRQRNVALAMALFEAKKCGTSAHSKMPRCAISQRKCTRYLGKAESAGNNSQINRTSPTCRHDRYSHLINLPQNLGNILIKLKHAPMSIPELIDRFSWPFQRWSDVCVNPEIPESVVEVKGNYFWVATGR